jgi:hypothetical protein
MKLTFAQRQLRRAAWAKLTPEQKSKIHEVKRAERKRATAALELVNTNGEIRCSTCRQYRSAMMFAIDPGTPLGILASCKNCMAEGQGEGMSCTFPLVVVTLAGAL